MEDTRLTVIEQTADLVAAYVSNNSVPFSELPALIAGIHGALASLHSGTAVAAEQPVEKPSAAQVRKSITPNGLVSFIDGKSYKTLKRHLTSHGMTPQDYRERFALPSDYPMVAAAYAAHRSELARAIGLGRPAKAAAPAPEPAPAPAPEAKAPRKGSKPKVAEKAAEPAAEEAKAPVRAAARTARKDPRKAAA